MSDYSLALGRGTRSALSANPELKSYVTDIISRAYSKLHGKPIASADAQWVGAMIAAGTQLCLNERVQQLNPRELVQLFETVLRVSEGHMHEARRHTAMATNVFYLNETALDAITNATPSIGAAATVVLQLSHSGRVRNEAPSDDELL